jgi:hypothetical protein
MPAKKTSSRKKTVRDCVDIAALTAALQEHALDGRKMAPSQVTAAITLLKMAEPALRPRDADLEEGSHEAALKDLE